MKRWIGTILFLAAALVGNADARPLGVLIRDTHFADPGYWTHGRVIYLDCNAGATCVEYPDYAAVPWHLRTTGLDEHERRVARIIDRTLRTAAGGSFQRGATLYSVRGSGGEAYERLLDWLTAGIPGTNLIRAQSRDIRVVQDTFGDGTQFTDAQCAALRPTPDPRISLLRARGITYFFPSGNGAYNDACYSPPKSASCDANARVVVGLWPDAAPDNEQNCDQPNVPVTPSPSQLWIGSNLSPSRLYVGASVHESSWVAPPYGGTSVTSNHGTSWAAPAVAAGHLAVIDRAPYLPVAEIENRTVAAAVAVTHPLANGSFVTIPRVDAGTFLSARNNPGLCAPAGPIRDGWWWDPNNGGSGVHFFTRDGRIHFGWFTYAADGRPTWRLGDEQLRPDGSIARVLQRVSGNPRVLAEVGTFQIEQCGPNALNLRWQLSGADTELGMQQGVESLTRFCLTGAPSNADGTCPDTHHSNRPDITGIYYQAGLPGAGYTVETQGNNVGIVHYFFDGADNPVWGTALVPTPSSSGTLEPVTMNVFTGSNKCLMCASDNPNVPAAGSLQFTLRYEHYMPKFGVYVPTQGVTTGSVPTSGSWPFPAIQAGTPSDPAWIRL